MGIPLFKFSSINHSMTSQNPCDTLNLFWNQQIEYNNAKSLVYMTPSYDFSTVWRFPEFSTFGNQLLNPLLAINQTMQNWNNNNYWGNNCWNFGNFGNFSNFNFPWSNNSNTNNDNSGKTDAERAAEKKMQREYDDLKALINEYKNIAQANKSINPDLLDKIEIALSKSGKIEEKLESLKNVYNDINKASLRKALTSLSSKDFNLKERLEKAGYNFGNKDYSFKNAKDTDLNSMLDRIHSEIAGLSSKNPNSLKEFKGLIEPMVTVGNNDILRVISYWNDKYGLTGDNKDSKDEGCIIRFMIKKMNGVDDNAKTDIQNSVNKLVDALTSKANYIKDNGEAFDEETLSALGAQITNVRKAKEAANFEALAKEFEKLYVMLRIMEAKQINKSINNKYSFLNSISNTDTDIIDENIIVKDTEADLKKEGLGDIDIKNIHLVDYQAPPKTAQEEVNDLVKEGTLKNAIDATDQKTELKDYYQDHEGTFYTIRDGKIIRLDGVTCIYSNGRCAINGKKGMHNIPEGTEVTKDDIPKEEKPSGSGSTTGDKDDSSDSTLREAAKRYYEYAKTQAANGGTRYLGKKFAEAICGNTDEDEFYKMQGYIRIIDKDNVANFIKGYYDSDSWYANGFFEQIAAENSSSQLTNGEVVSVLKALVEYFKNKKLEGQDETDFERIKEAYEDYRQKDQTEKFSNSEPGWRIFGVDKLDRLDDAVERLLKTGDAEE